MVLLILIQKMKSKKIIVALDFESCDKALALVESLDGYANFFKIGLGLIGRGGLELARELKKRGLHVYFLYRNTKAYFCRLDV